VWLLRPSGATAAAATGDVPRLDVALAKAAEGFAGISAIYTRDLTTGAEASWNDTARFPAASTVKLGVLAAALRQFAPYPEEQPAFYDLRALAGWSSNLAANRLAHRIGGAAVAQAELRRLGADSSTYRGNYTVGTALVPRSPPAVSATVTTARDLALVLTTLQRVAIGDPKARARSGLSVHGARVALGLLLSSQPAGDNAGLLRPALGGALPIAQKQGWLRSARLTAAIVYTGRGPRIVVICAYAPGLSRASAQLLGRRVAAALALR
jgi:beta-lactamase class A